MFPALARYLPPNLSDTGRVEALSTDEPLVMQLQGILGLRFVLRHRGAPAKRREAYLRRTGTARQSRYIDYQPVWTRITEQTVDELIAGKRNVEDLIPHRLKNPIARSKGLGR